MREKQRYSLTVPIEGAPAEFSGERKLKVAAIDAKGVSQSQVVDISKGKASVTFDFAEAPRGVRVVVGPAEAEDADLLELQTIKTSVSNRLFRASEAVQMKAILIPAPYLIWCWNWCRWFTISGQVLCPDQKPVPGATVSAFDVDWLPPWGNKQFLKSTVTDLNGFFTMTFRWCCGWPYWYLPLNRRWFVDLDLARKIIDALPAELKYRPIPPIGPEPDPVFYERILGVTPPSRPAPARELAFRPDVNADASTDTEARTVAPAVAAAVDFSRFEALRKPLRNLLGGFQINPNKIGWPYVPVYPWLDCNPDVIFTVTQPCNGLQTIILDEGSGDTRHNISVNTNVTLVAGANACCLEDDVPCSGQDCLILTQVCGVLANNIAGNPSSSVTALEYEGYASPHSADQPFAGNINVSGTTDCMDSADYYTFLKQRRTSPSSWTAEDPIDLLKLGSFDRWYLTLDTSTTPITVGWHQAMFNPTQIGTRFVYESRLHYEATHWTNPSLVYQWITNRDLLLVWKTAAADETDGVYRLRPQGYSEAGGVLTEVDLNECGTTENQVVLRLDNRFDPDTAHPPDHPCGTGTVHTCTTQPDVDIVAVKITKNDGTELPLAACGTFDRTQIQKIEIDFQASDPQGHLSAYSLKALYGENSKIDLLNLASGILSMVSADDLGLPDPVHEQRVYNPSWQVPALPQWNGGVFRLTLQGSAAIEDAFPIPCCYALDLSASNRTIVSCSSVFTNNAHYTFTVI